MEKEYLKRIKTIELITSTDPIEKNKLFQNWKGKILINLSNLHPILINHKDKFKQYVLKNGKYIYQQLNS